MPDFEADEKQAQAVVAQLLERVVIHMGAGVAAPRHVEPLHVLADLDGAGLVDGERVVVEHILAHFVAPDGFRLVQFPPHAFRAFGAVLMAADGLRPQAEGAFGRAAAPRVPRHIGMQQIPDEILGDVQMLGIRGQHGGHQIPIRNQLAVFGALNDPVVVAIRQARDRTPLAALGQFLAGVVELVTAHEINDLVFAQSLFGQDGDMRPDEAHFHVRVLLFEAAGAGHVVCQGRRTRVHDDEFVVFGDFEDVGVGLVVRGRVYEFAARHERGGLGQPRREPVGCDFALGLVARTGSAVETVERGRAEE